MTTLARRRSMALVTLAAFASACSAASGPQLPTIDEALAHQPAELVDLGDDLIIGDAEGGCGFPRHTTLLLLDDETGEVEWGRAVPWAPDDPIVLDDAVLSVSRTVDGNPPSISALDLDDGTARWQRFVASNDLTHAGVAGGVVQVVADSALLQVDASGQVVGQRELVGSVNIEPVMGDPNRRVIIDHDIDRGLAPVDGLPTEPAQVTSNGDVVIAAGGSTVVAVDLHGEDVWSTTTALTGGGYREIVAVDADAGTVVVLVRSGGGPNHRLVVLDAATGFERWRIDGVRDVEVAGDLVLYDVRVERPMDEPTRSTVIVDAAGGAELWRATSAGHLGGYIGRRGDSLVFLEAMGSEPATPVVVRADGVGAPDVLLGSERDELPFLLTDDSIVLGDEIATPAGGSTATSFGSDGHVVWEATTERTIQWLRATSEGLLISTGDSAYGCL